MIEEWCDANGLELAFVCRDVFADKFGPAEELPGLDRAFEHCLTHGAKFVYVGLQRFRKNQNFNRRLSLFAQKVGASMIEEISGREVVNHLKEVVDAAKLKKHQDKRRSSTSRVSFGILEIERIADWAINNGIDQRRLRNFWHLRCLLLDRFIIQAHSKGYSDRDIADELNDHGKLTVYGRRWTKETVRKARSVYESIEYNEFCKLVRSIG
ncbi:MAG TPA: hypothetical protein VD978_31445 [Azospirillum sp.]|nr:hypothetical protein [Azospirillum sp.]